MSTPQPKYKRILLKLSGEALGGESNFGISAEKIQKRREALLNGQTEAEAVRAEADVEKPTFNPAQDSAMEQYLFEKAKLSEPPFMNETAPVNE